MTILSGSLAFLNPILLWALLGLPLLWFLLRILPPSPVMIALPTTHFLKGLMPTNITASKTPLWLLILRILIVALIITAMARPVINPQTTPQFSENSVHIVLENDWAAARNWDTQIAIAKKLINAADRQGMGIYLSTTTPNEADNQMTLVPLIPSQALQSLAALSPNPWQADLSAINRATDSQNPPRMETLWLGHGLAAAGMAETMERLTQYGPVRYLRPDKESRAESWPVFIRTADQPTSDQNAQTLTLEIMGLSGRGQTLIVQSSNGTVLSQHDITMDASPDNPARYAATARTITLPLPQDMMQSAHSIRLSASSAGAGDVYLLDDYNTAQTIGIAGSLKDADAGNFGNAAYYLDRALPRSSEILFGTVASLIEQQPGMIILPDIAGLPADTLAALDKWVTQGGLLLRFAGPNMAESLTEQSLLPVPLIQGNRFAGGELSWTDAPTLAPFDQSSPFANLPVPDDLAVARQILADPSVDLSDKIWARLSDGTPLITVDRREDGMIVLVHTTASPLWSNLCLSGLFVDMLATLTRLSVTPVNSLDQTERLTPAFILQGDGTLAKAENSIETETDRATLQQSRPSAEIPPGLYRDQNGLLHASNLGDRLPTPIFAEEILPTNITKGSYDGEKEFPLYSLLLLIALGLWLLDWVCLSLVKSGYFAILISLLGAITILAPSQAHALEQVNAHGVTLAYIITGDTRIDEAIAAGLQQLGETAQQRTSIPFSGVAGIDPESDPLAFYPLIYWAITPSQTALSAKALTAIQRYLNNGGTILFDTRDGQTESGNQSRATEDLRRLTAQLTIPALHPIPDNHVLGRTFYLIADFPGHYRGGTFWVEQKSSAGRDDVSSVMIGSHDWPAAWRRATTEQALRTPRSRQDEMAIRFGINLMMYALTGNYKADQVHIPFILERLETR